MTLAANRFDPVQLDAPLFLLVLAIFLAYTLHWNLSLAREFRLPMDSGTWQGARRAGGCPKVGLERGRARSGEIEVN
ncbi:hypothetical protein CCR95_07430 [Thiocystis minor]|uniref:hypothetical protein n=1 Tax=Thiocystis minor TaxID=61597 RepID=UPI0019143F53|nr:hypothetical protein [Thiocystis minor]MBK5963923.1 hypothetical protein [Thiocystis minor]